MAMTVRPRSPLLVLLSSTVVLYALAIACGGGTPTPAPTQPTSPTTPAPSPGVTVASVQVGAAGNAGTTVAPGDKLQLFAQALNSDGSTIDVTNLAVWQSSNPVVATVSPTGLVTAAAEGAVDVNATYQSKSGSLHAEVQKPGCRAALSPATLAFGALSSSASVTVTTTLSDCRWTAKTGATWLTLINPDPGRSGNGTLSYTVAGNNNTDPREADIVVSVAGGPAALHHVRQERPVSCVYRVSPEKLTFGSAGGTGSFSISTVPGDCQWRITNFFSDLRITTASSGTGSATVSYALLANAGVFDRQLRVEGLSGVNPPGIHTVAIVR
jgi:hypothetical protein